MLDISRQRLDTYVRSELRASHAGEFGAVWIYRGALAVNWFRKDKQIQAFANQHLATEQRHLQGFESWIQYFRGSLLLSIWGLAGFITGALPALLGRDWFFYTIFCVESFVDEHYQAQIDQIDDKYHPLTRDIVSELKSYHADEKHHRDEALQNMQNSPTTFMRLWGKLIKVGSDSAVKLAKVI